MIGKSFKGVRFTIGRTFKQEGLKSGKGFAGIFLFGYGESLDTGRGYTDMNTKTGSL